MALMTLSLFGADDALASTTTSTSTDERAGRSKTSTSASPMESTVARAESSTITGPADQVAPGARAQTSPLPRAAPGDESALSSGVPDEDAPRSAWVGDDSDLTSGVRAEPEPDLDLLHVVLGAPQWILELAFTPLSALVLSMEKLRIHERLFHLFTNDERTFGIFPIFDPFDSTGMGFGAAVVHNDPLGSPDRFVLMGIVRTNLDRSASASFSRRLPWLSGRAVRLSVGYSVDRDLAFWGLGPDTSLSDRQLMRIENIGANTGITLLDPSVPEWSLDLDLGVRYRDLETGSGEFTGVTVGGAVTPPKGFGAGLLYPEGTVAVKFDTRDTKSRTTTGLKVRLEGGFSSDVNGGGTNALKGGGELAVFVPLAPRNRVLALSVGAAGSIALGEDTDVPFHQMVELGGSSRLRGYRGGRFIDRLGWWASAEYRWESFQLEDTGDGISTMLFFDVGRVAPDLETFFGLPIAWSAGLGLRFETDLFMLGQVQLGFSPEGVRISVKVGDF